MKPRDILSSYIKKAIAPSFAADGFSYSASRLRFQRKVGIAAQEISFSLSRWNRDGSCEFWTTWAAHATFYKKWHKQVFDVEPANDLLGGVADWNIPGWSHKTGIHRVLRNDGGDDKVVQGFQRDATGPGFAYLDSISTWHGAARRLIAEGWFYAKAADFFLIAEQRDSANEALLTGYRRYTVDKRVDQGDDLKEIVLRVKRFFPEQVRDLGA